MGRQLPPEQQLAALAPLAEPVRRALYLLAASRPEGISRDEAARALGITRALAAFHLDRLVEGGLLEAFFQRPPGRGGPGGGRPTKRYRRGGAELEVSLPPRRYDLLARLLLEGAGTRRGGRRALEAAARRTGAELGAGARRGRRGRAGTGSLLHALGGLGFEPRRVGEQVELGNCPFAALAREHPETVCALNRAFLQGLAEGIGLQRLEAVLDPRAGACCVRFVPPQATEAGEARGAARSRAATQAPPAPRATSPVAGGGSARGGRSRPGPTAASGRSR